MDTTRQSAIDAIADAINAYRADGYARSIYYDTDARTAYDNRISQPHPVYASWGELAAYCDKWLDDHATPAEDLAAGFVDLYHQEAMDGVTGEL